MTAQLRSGVGAFCPGAFGACNRWSAAKEQNKKPIFFLLQYKAEALPEGSHRQAKVRLCGSDDGPLRDRRKEVPAIKSDYRGSNTFSLQINDTNYRTIISLILIASGPMF